MEDTIFDDARFHDEDAARKHLESIRWPNGPVCPHCGASGRICRIESQSEEKGKGARPGLLFCGDCRKQFSVTVGTVFERSKVPLHKWVLATHLLCSSKKGISSHQLHRTLGVTYKTAWFMTHRIREAMKNDTAEMLGGSGPVEADETFVGNKPGAKIRRGWGHKNAVFSLVERNGEVRSFHVANVTAETLKPILKEQVTQGAHLMTDDGRQYLPIGREFAKHDVVKHSTGEYVRGDAHTNTVEGFFSIFKRGIYGVYQHVSPCHLHRYTTEFDFRFNHREKLGFDDTMREAKALKGISGKRLTYRRTD
ncbi:MAG: transposase [Deltaproteobacteria bacterium RBG_13_60_28]|nr:MAG: transposase [Deltaproteobacteria bacterium RBG_13_60_28]